MHPLLAPLVLAGLWYTLAREAAARGARSGSSYVALFVLFVTMHGKPYYLLGAYPAILAAGGVMLERLVAQPGRGRRRSSSCRRRSSAVADRAASCSPVERSSAIAAVGITQARASAPKRVRSRSSSPTCSGGSRWRGRSRARTPRSRRRSSARRRRSTRTTGARRAPSTSSEGSLGLPRAISGHNSYWLWGYAPFTGEVLIVIGGDAKDHEKAYEDVRARRRDRRAPGPLDRAGHRHLRLQEAAKAARESSGRHVRHYD